MTQKSAAARFREEASRAKENQEKEIFDVKSPNGFDWQLCDPDMEVFILGGVVPLGLANKLKTIKSEGVSDKEVFSKIDTSEQEKVFNFSRLLISSITHNPHVLEIVVDADKQISFAELAQMPGEYAFLSNWAESRIGGDKLDSFRNKRKPSVARGHGKAVRR